MTDGKWSIHRKVTNKMSWFRLKAVRVRRSRFLCSAEICLKKKWTTSHWNMFDLKQKKRAQGDGGFSIKSEFKVQKLNNESFCCLKLKIPPSSSDSWWCHHAARSRRFKSTVRRLRVKQLLCVKPEHSEPQQSGTQHQPEWVWRSKVSEEFNPGFCLQVRLLYSWAGGK